MSLRNVFDKLFRATPNLDDAETVRFLELIEEGLKHPKGPVPTPRLSRAREIAFEIRSGNGRLTADEKGITIECFPELHPDDFPKSRLDMGPRREPIQIGLCE